MQTFELPWPPSVNSYYRNVHGMVKISKQGREYREAIAYTLKDQQAQKIDGHLSMIVELYPPDNRRRDIDNVQKALWDALMHGGLYQDDSQIKHFECDMHEPMPPNGVVIVRIGAKIKWTKVKT